MKFLFTAILCFIVILSFSQDTVHLKSQDTIFLKKEAKHKVVTDREPQTVFFELAGPGVGYSFNYDRRCNKQTDGLGYRGGIGHLNTDDVSLVSIPVGINYLGGNKRRGRFFEFGLNQSLVFYKVKPRQNYFWRDTYLLNTKIDQDGTIALTSLTIGYRSQPVRGGFCFRVGLMPYTTYTAPPSVAAHISFGYNF